MADRRETGTTTEPSFSTSSTNVFDVYTDYVVQRQIDAANVPPRQKLDICFSDASKIGDNKSGSNQEAYEKAHGKLYDMTHKNTIPWRNYVVYLIILTMLTCCFTYSRYVSNATGDSSVSVAKFSYSIDGNIEGVIIDDDNQMASTPTVLFDDEAVTTQSYQFTITNGSDVSINVTPSVANNGNFVISFAKSDGTKVGLDNLFYMGVGSSETLTMTIDSTNVDNDTTANMALTFKIDQAN